MTACPPKPASRAHLFQPGKSGNPGGRPAVIAEVRDLARAHTTAAISTLAEIAADASASPSARVAAAACLLDRGWGRAPVSVDLAVGTASVQQQHLDAVRQLAGMPPIASYAVLHSDGDPVEEDAS